MKKQNVFLRLMCVLLATLMLVGVLSACNGGATEPTVPEDPTELPTEGGDPTIPEDPTNPEDPTEEPGGNVDDPDSPILDGDDHIEIPW